MNISFSKPPFLGSMLVFVGVAQKCQYHIGTIFSHTQPVERMLRLYLLGSFYAQVNHPRNFESQKNWESQKRWRHETPFFWTPGPWWKTWQKNPGRGVRKLSWCIDYRIHIYTSGFNFTFNTLLKLYTGDTRKGVVLCRFFTPRRGENKRNSRYLARLWQWPMVFRKRPMDPMANSQWFLENGPPSKHGSCCVPSVPSDGFTMPQLAWSAPQWEPPWSSKMLPTNNGELLGSDRLHGVGKQRLKFHRFLGGNSIYF